MCFGFVIAGIIRAEDDGEGEADAFEGGDREGFRWRYPDLPGASSGSAARIPRLLLRKLLEDEGDRKSAALGVGLAATEGLWPEMSAPVQSTSSSRSSTPGPSLAAAAASCPGGQEKTPRKRSAGGELRWRKASIPTHHQRETEKEREELKRVGKRMVTGEV